LARPRRVGTRGSPLAIAQTELVLKKLRQLHPESQFETVVIKTTGDRLTSAVELRSAGKGLFVKEIEQALLKRKIDFAVHSAKDLPTDLLPELAIAAVLERGNPSDLFIGRTLDSIEKLPPGAQVGTSSLRRQALLRALYPHVVPVELRGNLDTRLEKLRTPKYRLSGIVVATAGVRRLYPPEKIQGQVLPIDRFVPAAGQGILALESRAKDESIREFLSPLHHEGSATALEAERLVLRRLEGGCEAPLGVHAQVSDDGLVRLTAALCSLDGKSMILESTMGMGEDLASVAEALETMLKSRGAAELLLELPGRKVSKVSGNGHRRARQKSRR